MNEQSPQRRTADLVVAGALFIIGGLAIWGSRSLPPPMLEPIGPAAFPLAVGLVLVLLSLVVIVQALRPGMTVSPQEDEAPGWAAARPRNDLAWIVAALTGSYVAIMGAGVLSFRWATALFVMAVVVTLGGWGRRTVIAALALALVLGVGLDFLFTDFFYIDLPS